MVEEGQELGLKEFIPYPLKQSLKVNANIIPEVGDYRFLAIIPKRALAPKTLSYLPINTESSTQLR
jgi:hypothetical protein